MAQESVNRRTDEVRQRICGSLFKDDSDIFIVGFFKLPLVDLHPFFLITKRGFLGMKQLISQVLFSLGFEVQAMAMAKKQPGQHNGQLNASSLLCMYLYYLPCSYEFILPSLRGERIVPLLIQHHDIKSIFILQTVQMLLFVFMQVQFRILMGFYKLTLCFS